MALILWAAALNGSEQAKLQSGTTWPIQFNLLNNQIVGSWMELLPNSFFRNGNGSGGVLDFEILQAPSPELPNRIGQISSADRQQIILQYLEIVAFLHERGVVIGDIGWSNAVWSYPDLNVKLIDCDSMRIRGSAPAAPQGNSAGYELPPSFPMKPPSGQGIPETDLLKLGRFVVRTVTGMTDIITSKSTLSQCKNRLTEFGAELGMGAGWGLRAARLFIRSQDLSGREKGGQPSASEWLALISGQKNFYEIRPEPRSGRKSYEL